MTTGYKGALDSKRAVEKVPGSLGGSTGPYGGVE